MSTDMIGLRIPMPTVLLALCLLTTASLAQDGPFTDLPVPYPVNPPFGYTLGVQEAQEHGILFEWEPSRHEPRFAPQHYMVTVKHPEWPVERFHFVSNPQRHRERMRLHSNDFQGGALNLSLPGAYTWGVKAMGGEEVDPNTGVLWDVRSSHGDGRARGGHFNVQAGAGRPPASIFDIHADQRIDGKDVLALQRSWKRMEGDPGYNPLANLVGDTPLVDERDLMAFINRGTQRPGMVQPEAEEQILLTQFIQPGVTFSWTGVPGALYYLLEIDRRDDGGSYNVFATFQVRGLFFFWRNDMLFPVHSNDLRDVEANTMTTDGFRWRVRPVLLDGQGVASEPLFFRVIGQPPTPTPTATPDDSQLVIAPVNLLEPDHLKEVNTTNFNAGDVEFRWSQAVFSGQQGFSAGSPVPNVTYIFSVSAVVGIGAGQLLTIPSVETGDTFLDSSHFGRTLVSPTRVTWAVTAMAPNPGNPTQSLFSPPSPARTLRVSPRGDIPYPGDANGDRFTNHLDAFYLSRNYRRLVSASDIHDPQTKQAVRDARAALDLEQVINRNVINSLDVLEFVNFVQNGAFAKPTLPRPQPLSPTPNQVLGSGSVTLSWSPVANAADYFIVLDGPAYTYPEFRGRQIFVVPSNQTSLPVNLLGIPPVRYAWKVRAIPAEGLGIGGNFSEPVFFEWRAE